MGLSDIFERLDRLTGWSQPQQSSRAITPEDFGSGADLFDAATNAGERVTTDSAMGLMAVWGCVRLLVDDISTLPVDAYRSVGEGRKVELPTPGWVLSPAQDPNVTFIDHLGQAVFSYLVAGEVFIGATPSTAWPDVIEVIPPHDVKVLSEGRYSLRGKDEIFTADRIRHVRHLVQPGSLRGMNPIEAARQGLATMQAAERFGSTFFDNGAVMSGIIQAPQGATVDADQLAAQFKRKHDAKRKSHAIGVLTGGATWQQLSFSPEQTQFLQLRKYQVEDIARLFGVPPFKLGSTEPGAVAYASTVQAAIEYVRTAVAPIVTRLEKAYSSFIPGDDTFVKFNLNALLRADPRARYESYQVGLQGRFLKVDEVRALEDMAGFGDQGGGFVDTPNNVTVDPRVSEVVALVGAGFDPAAALAAVGLPPIRWSDKEPAPVPEPVRSISEERSAVVFNQWVQPETRAEAPIVNVEMAPPVVNVEAARAPDVRVEAPIVNVAAPSVTVAPEVRSEAPVVNVTVPEQKAPDVRVINEMPAVQDIRIVGTPPLDADVKRDNMGRISGVRGR